MARKEACLVLAGAREGRLEVRGHSAAGALQLRVNGEMQPVEATGDFVIHAEVPDATDARPAPLKGHTIVELAAAGAFSIATASVT
jgi:hypothetical protein